MQVDKEQLNVFSQKVGSILGEAIFQLSPQQEKILDSVLGRIFFRHNQQADQITPEEIRGALELVTEHLYPASLQA